MVYLDHAATTPVYPEVLDIEKEAELLYFANASSLHAAGRKSSRALEDARKRILNCFGVASTHTMVFTSGATESNNFFIKGIALKYQNRGKKIITTKVEHPSVTNAFRSLEALGFEVVELPVNDKGELEPQTLEAAMDQHTILVSVIGVNNETGSINDLKALSAVVKKYPKAFFHSDLTQAIGKAKIDYSCLDAFSFSAHKFGGRKGVGGLVFKKQIAPSPLLSGGAQEFSLRSGTPNVPGALGMAKALEISSQGIDGKIAKAHELNEYLRKSLMDLGEGRFNSPESGCPFILNFSLQKHKASVIIEALSEQEIYVSSVSACSSKSEPISHVLEAMGKSKEDAGNSIRVSFGYETAKEDLDAFVSTLSRLLKEVHPR